MKAGDLLQAHRLMVWRPNVGSGYTFTGFIVPLVRDVRSYDAFPSSLSMNSSKIWSYVWLSGTRVFPNELIEGLHVAVTRELEQDCKVVSE